jgi:hypothetical protein
MPCQILKLARERFEPSCKISCIEVAMWRLAELGVLIRNKGKYKVSSL